MDSDWSGLIVFAEVASIDEDLTWRGGVGWVKLCVSTALTVGFALYFCFKDYCMIVAGKLPQLHF